MLTSEPQRFRFQPASSPPQIAASIIRSRRKGMLACRSASERVGRKRSGYFAEMQVAMYSPLVDAHDPPGCGVGVGVGVGAGAGAGVGSRGVRNVWVADHGPVFLSSYART